jgi:hypothetical protein
MADFARFRKVVNSEALKAASKKSSLLALKTICHKNVINIMDSKSYINYLQIES